MNRFCFQQLLIKYRVEIPVLQRDYVQGNKKSKKSDEIGRDFILDIITYLSAENSSPLVLNFVYGKLINDENAEEIERNKENIQNLLETVGRFAETAGFLVSKEITRKQEQDDSDNIFIPFDGQQRLTTLFLLHFLVYSYCGESIDFLERFSYKTRTSSRDFIKALIDNSADFNEDRWNSISFETYIKDRNWFYDEWNNDPTVSSMISMMENIRFNFVIDAKTNYMKNIHEKLKNGSALVFDFMDIEENNLDDVLYIKMNASGKELSDYEKFKSWLIEYLEETKDCDDKKIVEKIKVSGWEEKLDGRWFDFFWKHDSGNTDGKLYYFIKQILLFDYFSHKSELIETDKEKKALQDTKRRDLYDLLNSREAVHFSKLGPLVTANSINYLFGILDIITADDFEEIGEVIESVWNSSFAKFDHVDFANLLVQKFSESASEKGLNLVHKVFIYSIFHYLTIMEGKFEKSTFKDWIRVSRNLIYNSRLDDYSQFISAIVAIRDFGNKALNVSANIHNDGFITYFPENQRKEEFQKRKLQTTAEISNIFGEVENHFYLYGQIGWLINISTNEYNDFDLNKFQQNYKEFSTIFTEQNLDSKEYYIIRALLSYNDKWLPWKGSNRWLLCKATRTDARSRDENWRTVFNEPEYRKTLMMLMEEINSHNNLTELIEKKKVNVNDYRRLLIEFPNQIGYCKQGLIRKDNDGKNLRLLGSSQLNHYHRELRTSILQDNFIDDKDDKYGWQRSDTKCYSRMIEQEKELRIYFNDNDNKFDIYLYENEECIKVEPSELQEKYPITFSKIKQFNEDLSYVTN